MTWHTKVPLWDNNYRKSAQAAEAALRKVKLRYTGTLCSYSSKPIIYTITYDKLSRFYQIWKKKFGNTALISCQLLGNGNWCKLQWLIYCACSSYGSTHEEHYQDHIKIIKNVFEWGYKRGLILWNKICAVLLFY